MLLLLILNILFMIASNIAAFVYNSFSWQLVLLGCQICTLLLAVYFYYWE